MSIAGKLNGACKLIEEQLEREICHFPCRHHILELLLKAVFEVTWNATTGPNVPIFKRFQDYWPQIDLTTFQTGIEDDFVNQALMKEKDAIIEFINAQFLVISRNSYRTNTSYNATFFKQNEYSFNDCLKEYNINLRNELQFC